ncbi:PaaX family transcriptional regulator C-terminal domain-containing protein [Paenibacillus sp. MMS18-CY102]|uniref:PaaX family transcriptional regulator C-terminal domain-containing protein n=1 Tax=Paenibacillus sp. MMS18-CY102 TaxID=2682849 RepID=UPI0013661400|nr:PaaX family transcriptional regulator C-terminal domain-containing protein [Paenibacillus sp. MMS18-CY102]MWC28334.1 hypothetical protein [Paenibacillus sp. MMS18-CY102]
MIEIPEKDRQIRNQVRMQVRINEAYIANRQWFHETFIPAAEPLNLKSDEELFVHFLTLDEMITELSLIDPMLPKQLLPVDWEGEKVYAELQQYLWRGSASTSRHPRITIVLSITNSNPKLQPLGWSFFVITKKCPLAT